MEAQKVPSSPFDENILMQLVKHRPIIYDKQHEDFRAGPLRKKAWQEIAKISGWDIDTVTKRWRVMRDRFVRELRRTKNMDNNDSRIHCSAFFTEMLFLVNHVKSKSYVAEASGIEEVSREIWESQESEDTDLRLETEQLETCIVSYNAAEPNEQTIDDDDTTENLSQALTYAVDENDEYVECYQADMTNEEEEETYEEGSDGYYEEEETLDLEESHADPQTVSQTDDILTVEDVPENQWFKKSSQDSKVFRKRRLTFDPQDEPPAKKDFIQPDSPAPSVSDIPEDEDAVFGKTIGLMLKKIPPHLKTTVKLKIFQSLAEFEIEHKLNEPK